MGYHNGLQQPSHGEAAGLSGAMASRWWSFSSEVECTTDNLSCDDPCVNTLSLLVTTTGYKRCHTSLGLSCTTIF
jgi:hypothetical protein